MNRSVRKTMSIKHRLNSGTGYNEIVDMLESGMEEQEIAAELGLPLDHLREINNGMMRDN